MLKASELRIFNLITQGGEITKVLHLEVNPKDWDRVNHKRLFDCAPITLTEDFLLRFGFRLIERKGRYGNIYAISVPDMDFVIERDFNDYISYFFGIEYSDSPDPKDDNTSYNFSYNLRFVHQLQNLYFAVVGEELVLQD